MEKRTLNDLVDLRLLPVAGISEGEVVGVSHHSLVIDQGGGDFVWDPSFVGTADDSKESDGIRITKYDDNGTFIKPDKVEGPAPGRWRRIEALGNPSMLQARWFGAVSYPSQKSSSKHAFDSHAAIQSALDALPIVTLNVARTPSGRFIRVGMVELSGGNTYIGETLRITCCCTLRGQGKGFTYLYAKFGAFPLSEGEKWMIQFEKPDEVSANNCFNTCCEDFTIYGLSSDDNGGCSGLSIFGAQGSHVKDMDIQQTGIRGVLCDGISIVGECWFANCLRGPLLDFRGGGGPGQQFGNLSIEHCNQAGLHIDPDNGLPYAALKIKDVSLCHFQQLQFEASPVNISIINGRGVKIDSLLANVARPGMESYGVHVSGDSYRLSIPEWFNLGGEPHTHPYTDDSIIAQAMGTAGEVKLLPNPVEPSLVVTATTTSAGVPVKTDVVRKQQSLGWFVRSKVPPETGTISTIEISGTPRDWSGVFLGNNGLRGMETAERGMLVHPFDQPGGILGRIVVARTTIDGTAARVSRVIVTGQGTRLVVLPEPDLTTGENPPPVMEFTTSNAGEDKPQGVSKIMISAANSGNSFASFSLKIEIL